MTVDIIEIVKKEVASPTGGFARYPWLASKSWVILVIRITVPVINKIASILFLVISFIIKIRIHRSIIIQLIISIKMLYVL